MASKCLITGGTGFIGVNLSSYLNDRSKPFDILSRGHLQAVSSEDLNGYETIIHLAGKAHDLRKTSMRLEYYQVNFGLTKKLYDAFQKSTAQKFIFISSVKAVADQLQDILTENTIAEPQTDYGISKLLAEQYLTEFKGDSNKCLYILRPCMTHGRGNKGNLNLLFKLVKSGIPYPLAAFENQRSFLSVQNLCFVINEIIDRQDIPNAIYNVSDDEPLSTGEVVSILAQALTRKARLWRLSPKTIKIIARVGDTLGLPFTSERLKKLTENYVVSNEKIKAAINKPLPLNVREGIQLTANAFVDNTEERRTFIVLPKTAY
jgi:nucleoside-diphosphate-sugar epimerase